MSNKLTLMIFIMAFIAMFVIPPNLLALDDTSSLQCDGGTVSQGDTEDGVRKKCGDPQKVTKAGSDSPTIWFYNFGSSEFVYYVSFTNGIVERIQMGGYGD